MLKEPTDRFCGGSSSRLLMFFFILRKQVLNDVHLDSDVRGEDREGGESEGTVVDGHISTTTTILALKTLCPVTGVPLTTLVVEVVDVDLVDILDLHQGAHDDEGGGGVSQPTVSLGLR